MRFLILSLLCAICTLHLRATTYRFVGQGNWQNALLWSPQIPNIQGGMLAGDSICIQGKCIISAGTQIDIQTPIIIRVEDSIMNEGTFRFFGALQINQGAVFINTGELIANQTHTTTDSFIANSIVNQGVFINAGQMLYTALYKGNDQMTNHGVFRNTQNIHMIGQFTNYGQLFNSGNWTLQQLFFVNAQSLPDSTQSDFVNNGQVHNSGIIESEGMWYNHGQFVSDHGEVYSGGRYIINTDTIIGNSFTAGVINAGWISPGLHAWETDTMHFYYDIHDQQGHLFLEVIDANHYDVITLEYGISSFYQTLLPAIDVVFHPNYQPAYGDSIQLIQILQEGPSPLKPVNLRLRGIPQAPTGYVWKTIYNARGFFLILDVALPLPPSYMELHAIFQQPDILLDWTVKELQQVQRFDIEHASDGMHFETLGSLEANHLTYHFTHQQPTIGVHYYRLKAIDIDGRYTYSHIKQVNCDPINQFSVKQLIEGSITLYNDQLQSIMIYDLSGRVIFSKELDEGWYQIPAAHLYPGQYFLRTLSHSYKLYK